MGGKKLVCVQEWHFRQGSNLTHVYGTAAAGRKERRAGVLFIGSQPASLGPDSAAFLIMAQPVKRVFCYPNPDPERARARLRVLHVWAARALCAGMWGAD